jgi:hypothetical protein
VNEDEDENDVDDVDDDGDKVTNEVTTAAVMSGSTKNGAWMGRATSALPADGSAFGAPASSVSLRSD